MIDNSKEYILCAAIKRKEKKQTPLGNPYHEGTNDILEIELGYRHHDILRRFSGEVQTSPDASGFYTSKGRFVDREEAMKIAYEAGQVTEEEAFFNGDFSILFSEDLY